LFFSLKVIPYISIDSQRSPEIYLDIVSDALEIPRDAWRSPETKIPGDPQKSPEIRFPGIPKDPG
jgi:hypothetical protein